MDCLEHLDLGLCPVREFGDISIPAHDHESLLIVGNVLNRQGGVDSLETDG